MANIEDEYLSRRVTSLIKEPTLQKHPSLSGMEHYWIGGKKINLTWMWSDETHVKWTSWRKNQPDNYGMLYNEDRIALTKDGTWNDFPGRKRLPFFCLAKIKEGIILMMIISPLLVILFCI